MNKDNYQQPAFPTYEHNGDGRLELSSEGMTLLDNIAIAAMQGMLSYEPLGWTASYVADIAQSSYAQAAAMLEERKKYIK